jgi:hypothetical protein
MPFCPVQESHLHTLGLQRVIIITNGPLVVLCVRFHCQERITNIADLFFTQAFDLGIGISLRYLKSSLLLIAAEMFTASVVGIITPSPGKVKKIPFSLT